MEADTGSDIRGFDIDNIIAEITIPVIKMSHTDRLAV